MLRLKIAYWKLTGHHQDYVNLQAKHSVKTREHSTNQQKILNTLDMFLPYVPDKQAVVVDAGCGDGWLLDQLKSRGYDNVKGVDLNDEKLATARHAGHDVVRTILPDMPYEPDSVDAVYCRDVYEHLLHGPRTLEKFAEILKPGGVLFLGTTKTGIGDEDNHSHTTEIKDVNQVKRDLLNAGFEILDVRKIPIESGEDYWAIAKKPGHEMSALRQKTVRGVASLAVLQAGRWVFTTASSILMYRLLTPFDFGVFVLAETYLVFANILADMGLEDVSVQHRKGNADAVLQSALLIRTLFSCTALAAIFLWSDDLAEAFRHPQSSLPLKMMAVTVVLNLFAFKSEAAIKRRLSFHQFIFPEITASFVSALTAFIFALMHWGYWSLVMSMLLGRAVRTAMVYRECPQPLLGPVDRVTLGELFHKGKYNALITLLYYAINQSVNIFVGRFLGVGIVGYFYLAFNWSNFVVTNGIQTLGRVVFPAVAGIEADRERVTRFYYQYLSRVSILAMMINAMLMVLAGDLIPMILGPQWKQAIVPCQILCLYGYIRALSSVASLILQSTGQFKKISEFLAIELALFLIIIYPFIQWNGIYGAAWAMVITKMAGFTLGTRAVLNLLGQSWMKTVEKILPSFWAALLMMAGLIYTKVLLNKIEVALPIGCLFAALVGAGIFLLSYALIHPSGREEMGLMAEDIAALWGKFKKEDKHESTK